MNEQNISNRVLIEVLQRVFENKYFKVLVNLKEFVGLLVFSIALLRGPFTVPDLQVYYEMRDISNPFYASAWYDSVQANSSAFTDATPVSKLLNSPVLMEISIKNNTSDEIKNIDLKIRKVYSISDVAIKSSNMALLAQLNALSRYELRSNAKVLSFPNLKALPPKSNLKLILWGDFGETFLSSDVEITSTAKSERILRYAKAAGISLFISDNLLFIVIFICGVCLLIGLKRIGASK